MMCLVLFEIGQMLLTCFAAQFILCCGNAHDIAGATFHEMFTSRLRSSISFHSLAPTPSVTSRLSVSMPASAATPACASSGVSWIFHWGRIFSFSLLQPLTAVLIAFFTAVLVL